MADPVGIDELARRASTTVRTVRLYQEKGLLPPPVRRGRRATYGPEHLTRLRLVQRLADRGYSLAAIKDLTGAWDARHGLGHVLGLEDALAEQAQTEPPRRYTADEIAAMFPADDDGASLDRAVRIGLLVPDGDGFLAPNPTMVEAGVRLVASGIPVAVAVELAAEIEAASGRLTERFLDAFVAHVWEPFERAGEPDDELAAVAELIRGHRALAVNAVASSIAHAMDDAIDRAVMARGAGGAGGAGDASAGSAGSAAPAAGDARADQ